MKGAILPLQQRPLRDPQTRLLGTDKIVTRAIGPHQVIGLAVLGYYLDLIQLATQAKLLDTRITLVVGEHLHPRLGGQRGEAQPPGHGRNHQARQQSHGNLVSFVFFVF